MPDMFVVAATSLRGVQGAKTAFEEDLAPLEVADQSYPTSKVAISTPRSIRSRFSLSTSVKGVASEPSTLSYAAELFPTLLTNLEAQGALASGSNQLQRGPAEQCRALRRSGHLTCSSASRTTSEIGSICSIRVKPNSPFHLDAGANRRRRKHSLQNAISFASRIGREDSIAVVSTLPIRSILRSPPKSRPVNSSMSLIGR